MTAEDDQTDSHYQDFDEVFGSAIDVAVRRAIDRVGREPLGDLELGDSSASDAAAMPTATTVTATEPDLEVEPDPPAPEGAAQDGPAPPSRRLRLEDGIDDRPDATTLPKGRLDGVNPYAVLGVSPSASWEQITAAYRRRARAWHPDGAEPDEAERRQELIRQLNVAYSRLRALRDRRLH